ncbi:hypothetical protein [Bacteroides ihuae]|uniref:hypothetical protein n=1 Tax=Bacteroides ihuae TaxID=1852362 RepID=UPI0008DAD540|nr:hypothetical protein [Bacteroides ihuae]
MLSLKSDFSHPSVKFVDVLKLKSKEDLKNVADLLGVLIPSKLRKGEYAMNLAEAMLCCPKEWLTQLTRPELMLLQRLVDAGSGYVEDSVVFTRSTLGSFSLVIIDHYSAQEGKVRYMLYDELRKAIAPHINDVLSSKEQITRFTVEQYAHGIVNLYGFSPYLKVMDLLNGYLKTSITEEEISESLEKSLLIKRFIFNKIDPFRSEVCIASPFLWNLKDLDDKLHKHPEIKNLKRFSKKEVFEAGRICSPYLPCAAADELKEYMMAHFGYSEADVDDEIQTLWLNIQEDENVLSMVSSIVSSQVSSAQEQQQGIKTFMNYCDQCPRWFLKGYSSTAGFELFEKRELAKKPLRLMRSFNMDAANNKH